MSHPKPVFSASAAASAPMVISFILTSTVAIVTTVTGDARQYATVSIINGSVTMWSCTMTHLNPTAVISHDLVAGSIMIRTGGSFNLNIPAATYPGSVVANMMIVTESTPGGQAFGGPIATWPLAT